MGPTEVKNLQSCHWVMYLRNLKHQFGVFGFHHSHSNFLSWVMKTRLGNQAKQKNCVGPTFFDNSVMSFGSYHSKHL